MNKKVILVAVMILVGALLINKISNYQQYCYNTGEISTHVLEVPKDNFCGPSYMLVNNSGETIAVSASSDSSKNTSEQVVFELEPTEMYRLNGDSFTTYTFEDTTDIEVKIIDLPEPELIVEPASDS